MAEAIHLRVGIDTAALMRDVDNAAVRLGSLDAAVALYAVQLIECSKEAEEFSFTVSEAFAMAATEAERITRLPQLPFARGFGESWQFHRPGEGAVLDVTMTAGWAAPMSGRRS